MHAGAASLSGKRGTDESTDPERLTALWAQKRGGVSGTTEPCSRLIICLKSLFPVPGGAALGLSPPWETPAQVTVWNNVVGPYLRRVTCWGPCAESVPWGHDSTYVKGCATAYLRNAHTECLVKSLVYRRRCLTVKDL